ncbi:MAG: OmpA family protein [Bacteroidia bacterium]|nr:OmpA family protein [Bacteroidia bacterium]
MLSSRISILLCGLLLCGAVYGQPGKGKKTGPLKQAKEHLLYEEYEQAIPHVRSLLQEEPGSAYYNFWMGKCLYLTYKKNQALPYFDKTNAINPDVDREFHFYYGLTLHYNLFFERAIEQYRIDLERYTPNSTNYLWVENRIEQCMYANKLTQRREGRKVRINNMGQAINSPYAEHSPVISANDSLLIYTARRPDCQGARPEDHFYDEDVYVARRLANGDWAEAMNIGTPVNGKGHDATILLNNKGDKMYLYRHTKDGAFYETKFDTLGKKWREPKKLKKPFNSKYYEACIAENPGENLIIFSSDRPGGFGGRDLWLSRKDDKGNWSSPENLGSEINTPFDDDAPYIHPDGKTLYFSSNGPNSLGGFDIFVTEYDSISEGWLPPLNMGHPVNTPDDDIYFSISSSGKYGYYSSGKEGGYGEKDIYQIKFPYFPYPRRYFIVELEGLVKDASTLEDINATVVLKERMTGNPLDTVYTGRDSNQFYFVLEDNAEYELAISADGYESTQDVVLTPTLDDDDILIERNYLLEKPVKIEVTPVVFNVEIMNVYFDFDKYFLRKEAKKELDEVIALLKDEQDLEIEVIGHTDFYGTYEYNVALSENRSKSVEKYLLANGIAPERLSYRFESENSPIETNSNDRGRQFNRRTEIRLYKDGQIFLKSKKLRSNMTVEDVAVDHTTPHGQAGYDNLRTLPPVEQKDMPNNEATGAGGNQDDLNAQVVVTKVDPDEVNETVVVEDEMMDEDLDYLEEDELISLEDDFDPADDLDILEDVLENEIEDHLEILEEEIADDLLDEEDELEEVEVMDEVAAVKEVKSVSAAEEAEALAAFNGLEIHHIYYDFDKYDLRKESKWVLDRAYDILAKNPGMTLEIYGHTDAHGSVPYNQKLSENRTISAMEYLTKRGISKDQMILTGFSELKPLDSNENDLGRQMNRRVEFRFQFNGKTIYRSIP